MSHIIKKLKKTFRMFLNSSNVVLSNKQNGELNNIFLKIMNDFTNKVQWTAPELLQEKAIISIYKFIPFIVDPVLNEYLQIYWNRFLSRMYFRNEYKISKLIDPEHFFEYYSKKKMENLYNLNKSDNKYNYLKIKFNEIKNNNINVKPLIVKLVQDNDYNFITQKNYRIYLIRSNNSITIHENTRSYNSNYIEFYDKIQENVYNKGIIWAFV